jgi:hypothetical protein
MRVLIVADVVASGEGYHRTAHERVAGGPLARF